MLDNVKILLDEGLIDIQDYNRRCLIINMLNCRPQEAEKFADPTHEANPLLASEYERMLFIWKGHYVEPNLHWNSMQKWTVEQLDKVYAGELWQKSVKLCTVKVCSFFRYLWCILYGHEFSGLIRVPSQGCFTAR